jgi:charged multivesicular body protein 3
VFREMMKAGILEEMIEDTMEGLEGEGEEEEEAAQAEIDRIMFELTAGALGTAPDALKGELFYNYRTGSELQR